MKKHFTPLQHVKELEDVGVPHEQALVHAKGLETVADVVTEVSDGDKDALRDEIKDAEGRLDEKIKDTEKRLTERIDDLEKSLRNELVIHRWALGLIATIASSNLGLSIYILQKLVPA